MKSTYKVILLSFLLSACGGQTIIINEAPARPEVKLQPKSSVAQQSSVAQLNIVIPKSESCLEKKGYSLVNQEMSGSSKICYYLSKKGGEK